MKKLFVVLTVLGILALGNVFAYADGPWPHPAPPIEPKSVQPPIITLSSPWPYPVNPFETKSVQPPIITNFMPQ